MQVSNLVSQHVKACAIEIFLCVLIFVVFDLGDQ